MNSLPFSCQRLSVLGTTREGPFIEMTEDYHAYLASEDWKAKRQEKLNHGGKKCEFCGSKKRLQIHHLTYERIFKEEMDDLMILCRRHHEAVEELYKAGSLSKRGNVDELRARTLTAMRVTPTEKESLDVDFWGISYHTARHDMVAILLRKPQFMEILTKKRKEAQQRIKAIAKSTKGLQGRLYTNMLMTYDAFHGIGSYNKFRKEVLEVAKRVGCRVHQRDHAVLLESASEVRGPLKRRGPTPEEKLDFEIKRLCDSIQGWAKQTKYDLAAGKAQVLLDILVAAHVPTPKLVSYSDGRHEWVTK